MISQREKHRRRDIGYGNMEMGTKRKEALIYSGEDLGDMSNQKVWAGKK